MPRGPLPGDCAICGCYRSRTRHHIIPVVYLGTAISQTDMAPLVKDKRNLICICEFCHYGILHGRVLISVPGWKYAMQLLWIAQCKQFGPGWLPWHQRMAALVGDWPAEKFLTSVVAEHSPWIDRYVYELISHEDALRERLLQEPVWWLC